MTQQPIVCQPDLRFLGKVDGIEEANVNLATEIGVSPVHSQMDSRVPSAINHDQFATWRPARLTIHGGNIVRLRRLAPVIAMLLTVAACSSGGSSPASSTPTASASTDTTEFAVKLTDALRIDPASMTVKVGTPVTFVVTNTGKAEHEFVLGDEAEQMAHEQSMGGMAMTDSATAISLKPGETKTLIYTFPKIGSFVAGCHEPGHYAGGMKATITVTE